MVEISFILLDYATMCSTILTVKAAVRLKWQAWPLLKRRSIRIMRCQQSSVISSAGTRAAIADVYGV